MKRSTHGVAVRLALSSRIAVSVRSAAVDPARRLQQRQRRRPGVLTMIETDGPPPCSAPRGR